MNDQQLEDLKHFIDSRFSQFEESFGEDLKQYVDTRIGESEALTGKTIKNEIEKLRQEMLNGFTGVGEAIETINQRLDEHIAQHQPA